ncbi:hypothetical protein SAMN05216284_115136 [Micromonospora sediminimaris]|nr:hypothetical protein SAMN05216284_115136 [Micromonospora sediminimaris]
MALLPCWCATVDRGRRTHPARRAASPGVDAAPAPPDSHATVGQQQDQDAVGKVAGGGELVDLGDGGSAPNPDPPQRSALTAKDPRKRVGDHGLRDRSRAKAAWRGQLPITTSDSDRQHRQSSGLEGGPLIRRQLVVRKSRLTRHPALDVHETAVPLAVTDQLEAAEVRILCRSADDKSRSRDASKGIIIRRSDEDRDCGANLGRRRTRINVVVHSFVTAHADLRHIALSRGPNGILQLEHAETAGGNRGKRQQPDTSASRTYCDASVSGIVGSRHDETVGQPSRHGWAQGQECWTDHPGPPTGQ